MKIVFIAIACLTLLCASAFCSEDALKGSISGTISGKNGESLSGGKVLLFRADSGPVPSQKRYWRIPDEIVDIGSDGRFIAKVAEGRYYVAAIKRTSNESIGPPKEGDIIYPYSRKELKSEQQNYVVSKGKNTDIGVIAEAVPFKNQSAASDLIITAIEGRIVDIQGNPVPDAIAFAYTLPKFTGKALLASARTENDGNYSLRVSDEGSYYIKIRTTRQGGHPIEGEIIGVYGNDTPLAVLVKAGEIKTGINVVGKPFKKQSSKGPVNSK
jgi:hypothetical protein